MEPTIVTLTRGLLSEVEAAGVCGRALGGVAVALRCESVLNPPLAREYHDIDLATSRDDAHRLSEVLINAGCTAPERFNALHGHARMMFTTSEGTHIDVIVDEFVMCHRLSLRRRLTIDSQTLTLADLLLTKLQIAKINHKDVGDIVAVLVDHQLTDGDDGINVDYIVKVLSEDWGWWRTVTANLEIVDELAPSFGLSEAERKHVHTQIRACRRAIGGGRRSLRWKARARIGERVPWRLDPEEVAT
jgi:hypothetical protein